MVAFCAERGREWGRTTPMHAHIPPISTLPYNPTFPIQKPPPVHSLHSHVHIPPFGFVMRIGSRIFTTKLGSAPFVTRILITKFGSICYNKIVHVTQSIAERLVRYENFCRKTCPQPHVPKHSCYSHFSLIFFLFPDHSLCCRKYFGCLIVKLFVISLLLNSTYG